MKKALLIKLEAPSYSSVGMESAFRDHFEVKSIDWQRIRFSHGVDGLDVLWQTILAECIGFSPDIIFCQFQKGEILTIEQWEKLATFGFVINYTEDVREDISWYEEVAPNIGLTIFTNVVDVIKINKAGYMFVGYNHLWYKPQPKTEKDYGDIVFIGNNYSASNLNFPYAKERQEMVSFMEERFGDRFRAYGLGQRYQMLPPSQVIEAYNNCKVVITHNNFKRSGYCSDRGLNATGCGATVVHEYFEGIYDMFEKNPYWYTWKTLDDLAENCERVLRRSVDVREAVSEYARINHSWLNRVKFVIGMTKLIKGENV